MTTDEPSWFFSDAWVFTAIAVRDLASCALTDVIAAADAMNHAILTEDELAQGVGRLAASGLVSVEGDRFALTAQGQALGSRRQGGLMGPVKSVQTLLQGVDLKEGRWPLAAETLDAACKAYKRRLRNNQ